MSWKDSLGQFASWLGDISGVSDVADEVSMARQSGGIDASEWKSIVWQGAQVPFETAFAAPFRTLGKAGELYYEDFFRPVVANTAKVAVLGSVQAPLWKKRNETYGQYLSRAWEQRDDVSYGEIVGMGYKGAFDKLTGGTPDFSPFSQDDQEKWRESNWHWASGSVDFTKDLMFDPMTYVGTPVKAVGAALRSPKIVSESERAAAGVFARKGMISIEKMPELIDAGKFDDTMQFWASETNRTVLGNWFQREMGVVDPDAAAYLAGRVDDVDAARDLARVLTLSDQQAADRLAARYGAGYDLTLRNEQYSERAAAHMMASGDDLISAETDPTLHALLEGYLNEVDEAPEVAAAMRRAAEGPKAREEFTRGLDTMMDAEPKAKFAPARSTRAAEAGQRRAVRASVGVTREPIVTEYRPSRWHPSTYIVERPSGLVRPEADDALDEITAQIREIDKLTRGELVTSGLADDVIERWLAAGTLDDPASARGSIAHSLNEIGLRLMGRKYSLSEEATQKLFEHATGRSAKLTQTLREKGWLGLVLDNGSMGLLRSPVLQRTTPNAVQLWDFRQIDRTFARFEGSGWQRVYHSGLASSALDVADLVNTIFKTSVLLRLGYTIRNLAEAGLSIAATGNLGHMLAAVGQERVVTMLRAARAPKRLIDRIATSYFLRDNIEDVQYGVRSLEAQLAAKDAQLAGLARDIAFTDHVALINSTDPDDVAAGWEMARIHGLLGREDTYRGDVAEFVVDATRPISTTGIVGAAQRHADTQGWQPMQVADYAKWGDKRGLLGPHPDVDKNVYGRAGQQFHGGSRWTGDLADPDARAAMRMAYPELYDDKGRLRPDWAKTARNRENLVGTGFYTDDTERVAREGYAGFAADPQVYTVRWKHLTAPKMFDADLPAREHPEVQRFIDDFFDDLSEVANAKAPGEHNRLAIEADLRKAVDSALDPQEPLLGHAAASTMETLDGVAHGYLSPAEAGEQIRDNLKHNPGTPQQDALVREALDMLSRPDELDLVDLGSLIDRLSTSESMAWNWYPLYLPKTYEGDDLHDHTSSLIGSLGDALSEMVLKSEVLDRDNGMQVATDPKVTAFFQKWFGIDPADFSSWADRVGSEARAGANDIDAYLNGIRDEGMRLVNDAWSSRLREEGYDGIVHSSGIGTPYSESEFGLRHRVMSFLNPDDVAAVGRDWLDYDNTKILDASRAMAEELLERVRNGERVRRVIRDDRPGLGVVHGDHAAVSYEDITESKIRGWLLDPVAMSRAFGYSEKKRNPFSFRDRFEVLPAGVSPQVAQITSYGRTLDLTGNWASIPDDVKRAMGWTHHHQTGAKRRRGRAFTGDRQALKVGNQAVTQQVLDAAYGAGYARVILPDRHAFGGRQVMVDPRAVGDDGLLRETQRIVDDAKARAVVTPAPQQAKPTMFTRMQEHATRQQGRPYRALGNADPRAVVPGFEQLSAWGHLNIGIDGALSSLLSERAAIEAATSSMRERLVSVRARQEKLAGTKGRFGTKGFTVANKFGEDYDVAGPFAGHPGSLHARPSPSDDSYHHLIVGSDVATKAGAALAPVSVDPTNPRYYEGWSNILNMHFRDPESRMIDPVVGKILDGESYDDLIDWATRTREGYDWAHAIGLPRSSTAKLDDAAQITAAKRAAWDASGAGRNIDPENIEQAVAGLYRAVDLYLPEGQIRQAFREGGDLSADALERARQGLENPTLHALLVPSSKEARMAWAKGDYVRAGAAKTMRVLGALPETAFARHPLYATLYRDEMTTRLTKATELRGRSLTVGEINKIAEDAHRMAKRDLEKTLFTIVRRSNISGAAIPRLLFPFGSAYENVLRRWGGFVKADPSMPMRAAVLVSKFVANTNFISPTGEHVKGAGDLTGDSYMVLPGMDSIGRFIGGRYGRALESQALGIQVPMASLDVLFQGHPGDPGMGPIGLLPISEVLKRKPSLDKFLGWTMPYGIPEDQIDLFLPAWARRVQSAWSEDSVYANTVSEVYLVEQWKYENGQREAPPTLAEVTEVADAFFAIRTLTNLTSPVSVTYTNERDFYVTKLRSLREAYKDQPGGYRRAEAEFFLQFPDTQMLVQSLSRNPSGAQATAGAVENLQRYREEAASAYALDDPELAGFIANYGSPSSGQQQFSDAAYEWEKRNSASPGSTDTYRQAANPEQAVREAHVTEGWRQWRAITEQVSSRLEASGVAAGSTLFNTYMSQVKARAAEAIGSDGGNTDWYYGYINPDTAKYFRRAEYFEELVTSSQFAKDKANDPLMRSIAVYLARRKQVQAIIEQRVAAGGNKTLTAQSNSDVASAWDTITAQLDADSPEFAAWRSRYFATDPITMR